MVVEEEIRRKKRKYGGGERGNVKDREGTGTRRKKMKEMKMKKCEGGNMEIMRRKRWKRGRGN